MYLFDESGTRIGMTYNGQNYYYLFNAQGDVATSVLNGEVTISNWQTYTGAAVGGAVGGVVLAT